MERLRLETHQTSHAFGTAANRRVKRDGLMGDWGERSCPRVGRIGLTQVNWLFYILMDIQMPGMDGMTATRRIREMTGAASRIPIVALTANALDSQAAEYKAAGMDAHFPKPINMKALIGLIARLMRQNAGDNPRWEAESKPAPLSCPIARLRDEYRDYLSTVSGEFEKILQLSSDEQAISSVGALAHAIAGTAGNLGFAAVSDEAFALEAVANKIRKSPCTSQALLPDLNTFLNTVAVGCA